MLSKKFKLLHLIRKVRTCHALLNHVTGLCQVTISPTKCNFCAVLRLNVSFHLTLYVTFNQKPAHMQFRSPSIYNNDTCTNKIKQKLCYVRNITTWPAMSLFAFTETLGLLDDKVILEKQNVVIRVSIWPRE